MHAYDIPAYIRSSRPLLESALGQIAMVRTGDGPLDGYAVEAQVGFLLRRAHQRHAALFQDGMAPHDLTPTQFTALIKISETGRVTQNQLGRLAAMDPATIQGVVRRLISRGLVRRAPDPRDRRTAVLTPTEPGLDLVARAIAPARAITEATLQPLDAAERLIFLSLLRRLAAPQDLNRPESFDERDD